MREEKVFLQGRKCNENRSRDRLTGNRKEAILKEFRKTTSDAEEVVSLTKRIEMVQIRGKGEEMLQNMEQLNAIAQGSEQPPETGESEGEKEISQKEKLETATKKLPLPQVTITCPLTIDRTFDGPNSNTDSNKEEKQDEQGENSQKNGKLAGRRALPEITITCPPVEAFDIPDNDAFTNGLFTKRKYMICRESPRSGRRRISLVDFPSGLSSFEKSDSMYLESPANFVDSPYSFANVDLSFTYTSPLSSPFTPPFTPELRRSSKFIYPGAVPIFRLEESFPPAAFDDDAPKS